MPILLEHMCPLDQDLAVLTSHNIMLFIIDDPDFAMLRGKTNGTRGCISIGMGLMNRDCAGLGCSINLERGHALAYPGFNAGIRNECGSGRHAA